MLHTVTQYLKESADKYPDYTALIDNAFTLTYNEILIKAECIAYALISRGYHNKPIAVQMNKCANSIVAFFGIALSGNFYTVIDNKMPLNRVERILQTFEPCIVLTDKSNEENVQSLKWDYIIYESVIKEHITQKEQEQIKKIENKIIDTDILYVLFTSGSTGVPKGVTITHRSVIDYIEWISETFHFDHNMIACNQAPFFFDNSVMDIYSTIRNGAMLHIVPQSLYSFPIRLLEYIRDHKVNTIFWVPTILSRVADLDLLDKCEIDCLQRVLFAGEVMPSRQLNEWIRRLPNATFANLYGPTEITVDCTYFIVDRHIRDDEPVPIGYACDNSDVFILNEKNELARNGEKGELCVRGSSLSFGYYNNPEKTAEVFVQNPLNSHYREIIYRTGDIVHYNEYGELIFDGRRDNQIKHLGHRIELGEIETAVSSNSLIYSNCCMHEPIHDQLILFYVGDIEDNELRLFLTKSLPDYMLPNTYRKMDHMPINLNGKIDRVILKDMLQ